jgi:hypothetical protein
MALFNFLKTIKPVQFDFKPRFYDSDKEAREKRLKEVEASQKGDIEGMKERIASGFRRPESLDAIHYRRKQTIRSNMMVIALIFFLGLLVLLFFNVLLPYLAR